MPELSDAAFAELSTDEATGRRAWELTQPEAAALDPRPTRLPTVPPERVASGILGAMGAVQTEQEAMLKRLSADEQALLEAALSRAPRLCHATHFVYGQFLLSDPARRSRPLLEEGATLRLNGLDWTERLEGLGLVPAGRTAAIRAGSGHMDLARDLQALALELAPRLTLIQTLQQLQQDHTDADAPNGRRAAAPLTPADVTRMEVVGTQLVALLSGDDIVRPWHAELLATVALLEGDWKLIHDAWTYHRSRSAGAPPPSFHTLGRG